MGLNPAGVTERQEKRPSKVHFSLVFFFSFSVAQPVAGRDRRSQFAGVTFYILCLHNVDNYLLQSQNEHEIQLFLIVLERKKFDFVLFFQNKQ